MTAASLPPHWWGDGCVRTINIFLTDPMAGDLPDFENGDLCYAFARLYPDGPRRLVEGPVCAFVDWVMDDLSGLEMCRRLRSDPRMQDAHITIVLEEDDAQDKRRALYRQMAIMVRDNSGLILPVFNNYLNARSVKMQGWIDDVGNDLSNGQIASRAWIVS